jgi:hypothetical protein
LATAVAGDISKNFTVQASQLWKEPLYQLGRQEHIIWANAIKSAPPYRPKEAARHAQRLASYVEAAAARAAGQLELGLKKELYQALGLTL